MGILDTVNARLAVKKQAQEAVSISPLERVAKSIQVDFEAQSTLVQKDWGTWNAEHAKQGKNGYVVFHPKGKTEMRADTSYEAQQKTIAMHKIPKSKQHMVTPMLAEKGNEQVTHSTSSLKSEKHPGFAKESEKIADKEGLSEESAEAILASAGRKASTAAKKKNPALSKINKDFTFLNQTRNPDPDSNVGWKKQQAAQAAAKPKKPYLG
jgi:hypothetical protein